MKGIIFWLEIIGLISAIGIGVMIMLTPDSDKSALIWIGILGVLIGLDLVVKKSKTEDKI